MECEYDKERADADKYSEYGENKREGMLATAADLDGLPPSQINQSGPKDFVDSRTKSQLTNVSHTPNEQLRFGPRNTPPRVCLDADYYLSFARGKGSWTSRGTAISARM